MYLPTLSISPDTEEQMSPEGHKAQITRMVQTGCCLCEGKPSFAHL